MKKRALRTFTPGKHPRPLRPEVLLLDTLPRAQICIYDDQIILTRRDTYGRWVSHPITADSLIQTIGQLPVSAGLLTEGTISTGVHKGHRYFVQRLPAKQTRLQISDGRTDLITLTLPSLIWAGWRSEYRVFALADSEIQPTTTLYRAPFPNTYSSGAICWGSTPIQTASSSQLAQRMLITFLEESVFTTHLADGKSKQNTNILQQLRSLAGLPDTAYPVDDLVPTGYILETILSGSIWSNV